MMNNSVGCQAQITFLQWNIVKHYGRRIVQSLKEQNVRVQPAALDGFGSDASSTLQEVPQPVDISSNSPHHAQTWKPSPHPPIWFLVLVLPTIILCAKFVL